MNTHVTTKQRTRRRPDARLTIGFLTQNILDSRFQEAWQGVVDALREADVNVICLPVHALFKEEQRKINQRKLLYELIAPERLDGVLVFQWWEDRPWVAQFYERFHPLPIMTMCSIELDSPTVRAGYYQGIRTLVRHLIETHGYRRIAFLQGPANHPEAQTKLRGYRDELAAHGLALDERLVPPFVSQGPQKGRQMMRYMLDESQVKVGQDLNAIVGWHDGIALEALVELEERGIRVPHEVALTGFGGLRNAEESAPPLTTMPIPWYEMGQTAARRLLAWLHTGDVPDDLLVSPRLLTRRSCGCLNPDILNVSQVLNRPSQVELSAGVLQKAPLLAALRDSEKTGWKPNAHWAEELVDALLADLAAEGAMASATAETTADNAFLTTLETHCQQMTQQGRPLHSGQLMLSALHRALLPQLVGSQLTGASVADQRLHQGRMLVEELTRWAEARRQTVVQQQADVLRQIGQQLITTFNIDDLLRVIKTGVDRLGIPGVYVSLYVSPENPAEEIRLIFAFQNGDCAELPAGGPQIRRRTTDYADRRTDSGAGRTGCAWHMVADHQNAVAR